MRSLRNSELKCRLLGGVAASSIFAGMLGQASSALAAVDAGASLATEGVAASAPAQETTPSTRQSAQSAGQGAASFSSNTLEEVVVTAQKREERLQDVPASVSVLNTTSLTTANESRLRDYFDSVPGFQVSPSPGGGNQQVLAIRGVTSGNYANPTVGIMIDEIPFGSSTYDFSPDVDPSDLQRIEVLRGPQGTLYGANSLGGLVKYVTMDPSTNALSGRFQAGAEGVDRSGSAGYAFRGEVNLPVTDTLAVRASGFTTRDPGYIDNPVLNKNDVNTSYSSGGHVAALWKPVDNLSIKLSALYQHSDADGSSEEVHAPGLAAYQQNYIPNTGQWTKTIQAYSAIIQAGLGPIDLTSVTGYSHFQTTAYQDYTAIAPWGGYAQTLFGVSGAPSYFNAGVERVTEEIRATFKTGDMLDWLVGAFYSNENNPIAQTISGENTTTGAVDGAILSFDIPYKYREYALFVDPTLHLTNRFSVQFGGRYSWTSADFEQVTETGALLGGSTVELPAINKDAGVFTYLVTPQFKINDDLMIYARDATGYRPGRSNSFNPDPTVPRAANADKTTNYEVGVKGTVVPQMLSFDASLYYIDWKDIQITLVSASNGLAYTSNAARAKSEGVELSTTFRPGAGLAFSGWVSLNKAVLTEGVVNSATYAPTGAWLPFTARFTANLSVDKTFVISNNLTGSLGAGLSHVGERYGTFIGTPARAVYPAYDKVDLHAGLDRNSWSFNLYAKNVGNTHGLLGGGAGNYPPTAYAYIQPLSVGASISKTF